MKKQRENFLIILDSRENNTILMSRQNQRRRDRDTSRGSWDTSCKKRKRQNMRRTGNCWRHKLPKTRPRTMLILSKNCTSRRYRWLRGTRLLPSESPWQRNTLGRLVWRQRSTNRLNLEMVRVHITSPIFSSRLETVKTLITFLPPIFLNWTILRTLTLPEEEGRSIGKLQTLWSRLQKGRPSRRW